MGWVATAKLEVLKVAVVVPALFTKVPWPMLVPPSEKITWPVEVPRLLLVTVAVNMTLWPHTEGLTADASVVVVLALFTVWVSVPLLVVKFASPP